MTKLQRKIQQSVKMLVAAGFQPDGDGVLRHMFPVARGAGQMAVVWPPGTRLGYEGWAIKLVDLDSSRDGELEISGTTSFSVDHPVDYPMRSVWNKVQHFHYYRGRREALEEVRFKLRPLMEAIEAHQLNTL